MRLFVSGTDTDAGKTEVSCALLHLAQKQGLSTAAMKPVAAGCELHDGVLKNQDAIRLQAQCSLDLPYAAVNPVALKAALSPHLAAFAEQRNITVDRLLGLTQNIFNQKADFTLIEGAGGWRVPINHRELLSAYVKQLNVPVLLVVGMRLGCLNHALLSAEAILNDGLSLAGWVANQIDPQMQAFDENVQTLQRLLPAPCVGVIPHLPTLGTEIFAQHLDFDVLQQKKFK